MGIRALIAALVVFAGAGAVPGAASAHVPFLGEPVTAFGLPGEGHVLASASNARGGAALVLFEQLLGRNAYVVEHRETDGVWRSFEIFPTGSMQAIRFAALSDGGFVAVWDDDYRGDINAQSWTAKGAVGPVRTILDHVMPVREGDSPTAGWRMQTDGRGSAVVVASGIAPRVPGALYAVALDPGGDFGPAQKISPAVPTLSGPADPLMGALGSDGSVMVQWEARDGSLAGPGHAAGQAVRQGRGMFGPPEALGTHVPVSLIPPGASGDVEVVTRTSDLLKLDHTITRLCRCVEISTVTYANGGRQVFVLAHADGRRGSYTWFSLRRRHSGAWGLPQLVTASSGGQPLLIGPRGPVMFVHSTWDTDYGLFQSRGSIFLVPFGITDGRRRPTVRLGPIASAHRKIFLAPVWCDEPCRIVAANGARPVVRSSQGLTGLNPTLEPNVVGWLRLPRAREASRLQVTVAIEDFSGNKAHATARYRPGGRPAGTWCRVGLRDAGLGCR